MTRRGRNEGSIGDTKRADGRYQGRVDLGWIDGRRVRKSVYGKTKEEVRVKVAAAMRRRDDGLAPAPDRLTVAAYLTDWLASTEGQIRPSTFYSYSTIVAKHLIPTIGQVRLVALTGAQVEAMMRSRSKLGLSPRRVALIRATLRVALGRAVRLHIVARNVVTETRPPKQDPATVVPLDNAQLTALLAAVEGHRLEALFVLAVKSGMRSGELIGLQWGDVHLNRSEVYVRHALQRIAGEQELVAPKTKAGERTIALSAKAVDALRAHRVRQVQERLAAGAGWQPTIPDLVFCTATGTPLDQANLLRSLHAILEREKLPRQRFHDLRHAMASAMINDGISPKVVQERLGHSTITMTMAIYAHASSKARRDAADRMDALIG
jgi:integrase